MIGQIFKAWVEDNIELLKNKGISTEFVMPNEGDVGFLVKPFIKINQETEHCMSQVVVYESREMEFENLDDSFNFNKDVGMNI